MVYRTILDNIFKNQIYTIIFIYFFKENHLGFCDASGLNKEATYSDGNFKYIQCKTNFYTKATNSPK